MKPAFLDSLSWEIAEVYGAITDQILINLAKYFPTYNAQTFPRSSIRYQAAMLAQMGQVNKETMRIIRRNLMGCDKYLKAALEQVVIDGVEESTPELVDAVKKGIFAPPAVPVVAPNQYRAFNLYYTQAANKLNMVNTVMLESTQQAYQATVADVAARVQAIQTALDIGAGETITGVSTWNQATQHAIDRLKRDGITGFIDHAGRHWSAEAYVAMDVRTTMFNTSRAAIWETNESFGNDLYRVSYHNGARPLCYPWQNKVISSTDSARVVADLDGYEVEVIAQSATSYGEAAGLFGINCKHYPMPFIPGVSVIRDEVPQDEQENAQAYAESQEQRRLERKLRESRRDLLMEKARGAPQETIDKLEDKCKQDSKEINEFCKKTGRQRRRDREQVYTERKFPAADTYDVTAFEHKQKDMLEGFFSVGGAQVEYSNTPGMIPNVPIIPKPRPATVPQTPPGGVSYGKPFEMDGYRKPQQVQLANAQATLDKAPEPAKRAWRKVQDKLERPQLDPSDDGAYYSPGDKRTHYKSWKKCFEQSTYQRKNAVFFHEYGHNIDNMLGGGGWSHDNYLSMQYVGKNGKKFMDMLDSEVEKTLGQYYLKQHGFADAYDAVKAAQNGAGGMGFGSFTRQMLKGVMPGNEWRAIRDTVINAGDDDAILRPLVDKWLTPQFQHELRAIVSGDKTTATAFCDWVTKTYNIYERGDVSDIFGNYMTRHFGRDFTHPFGVGHKYSYQLDATNMPIEAFAEMYSALVTQSDALRGFQDFLPESYDFFLEMLGSV